MSLIIDISLHIDLLLLNIVLSQNPGLIRKQPLILSGRRQCVLNYRLSKLMALGLSLHFRPARRRLVVDGCIKLNTVQMGLLSVTKHDW